MHSGRYLHQVFFLFALVAITILSCKDSKNKNISIVSPSEGSSFKSGGMLFVKTDAEPGSFDSIKYQIDGRDITTVTDTQSVEVATGGLAFGGRLITAIVYSDNEKTEINTNFQLIPAKAAQKLTYTVVNTFPHDTSSYTQGLEYHDGILYESDGLKGESSLRKVEVKTGKILKKVDIPAQYFAEGITLVGNKIIMLTYQEGVGFIFDKNTLAKIGEFPYPGNREGWGLAFDGTHLLNSDGSSTIYYLDKDTYQIKKSIEVYDHNGPVDSLNELEYINGKIWANIYMSDRVVIINPVTGGVEQELNLQDLSPYADRQETGYVLNGIAWDAKGERLFVTGKKWNKLYQIQVK
jgi:glutaminyl-peptide cyclotransferase